MPNRIFNVKQASKILGLSTNTTYKYLNEGRIKAARGHIRGTFIITSKALEDFLGTKLPDESFGDQDTVLSQSQNHSIKDGEVVIEVTPPSLALRVTRILILLCLLLIIIDIILAKEFDVLSAIIKVALVSLAFLISYQFGGFQKK